MCKSKNIVSRWDNIKKKCTPLRGMHQKKINKNQKIKKFRFMKTKKNSLNVFITK